ncbi:MAG: hypothetical protein HC807_07945 [Gammaproteobacteria bacterium]|nr:hypothetical protein [Gammaproteobacteria bacterium]
MKNTYIGTPMERREDLRFLRGRGEFVDDLAVDGLLHAVILRSSVAHGRILSLDVSAARRRPRPCRGPVALAPHGLHRGFCAT